MILELLTTGRQKHLLTPNDFEKLKLIDNKYYYESEDKGLVKAEGLIQLKIGIKKEDSPKLNQIPFLPLRLEGKSLCVECLECAKNSLKGSDGLG